MVYIVGFIVLALLFYFIAIPLIKLIIAAFMALLSLLGSLLTIVIAIGIVIAVLALCIAFPILFIPLGIFIFAAMSKSSPSGGEK